MATYKAWNEHFDRIPKDKLKAYMKACDILMKDSMIEQEYGSDLRSLKILMNASAGTR